MAAQKKYYAIKVGRKTGIFNSWAKCKEQIFAFSGAVYKSFETLEAAKNYLDISDKKTDKTNSDVVDLAKNSETAIAYVDGSYSNELNSFSAAAVIFWNNSTYNISKKYQDKELLSMRNVAGEIKAAEMAIKFCLKNNIKYLTIIHDYEGISRWADGSWTANKVGTKKYSRFCNDVRKYINLKFVKVKGHSGNKYNDMADKLAKSALYN